MLVIAHPGAVGQDFAPARGAEGGDQRLMRGIDDLRAASRAAAGGGQRPQAPLQIAIIDNSIPNAWAVRGGRRLPSIAACDPAHSESELEAVLGHVIVHAAARHSAQAIRAACGSRGGILKPRSLLERQRFRGYLSRRRGHRGPARRVQRYGREAELESDRYGIDYMTRAGSTRRAWSSLQETFVRIMIQRTPAGWRGSCERPAVGRAAGSKSPQMPACRRVATRA